MACLALNAGCGDDTGTPADTGETTGGETDGTDGTTMTPTTMPPTTMPPTTMPPTTDDTTTGPDPMTGTTGSMTDGGTETGTDGGTETDGGTDTDAGFCGDGVIDDGEECDDGEDNGSGMACLDDCVLNVCGDGDVGSREGCDDGNEIDDDECTNACALPTCGDGILHDGEECDDGNEIDTDECLSTYVDAECGDGVVWDGVEECDDNNLDDDDGCNSTCQDEFCGDGVIQTGEQCDDNNMMDGDGCSMTCMLEGGDTCADPIVIDAGALPYASSGDTLDYNNDYGYSSGVCPGEAGGFNSGAEDVVYSFTPAETGVYTIVFDTDWDSTVYTVTDCSDIDNTCVAGADNGNPETINTVLEAGTTYYIIGGHWSNDTPGNGGPYTLTVSDVCQPMCDGISCDIDDGCGGTCGCDAGEYCGDGTCTAVPSEGDTCDAPIVVPSAPYTDSGTTLVYTNNYGYSDGVCPGETSGWNSGAEDVVYAFTPTESGTYFIEFVTDYDSTVYMVTDCADVDGTCVGGADNGNPETIAADLTAGTTYYIIGGHFSNLTPGNGGPYTLNISGVIDASEGDTCDAPIVVGALPYFDTGNTLAYNNDYGYSDGVCPGETGGWNDGAEDVVYAFTPPADGEYTIVFEATWDSTVYMVTDCADVDGTCVAGVDTLVDAETIVTTLSADITYYIIGGHWSNSTPGSGGAYTLSITAN